jgi:hypothetical protein
MSSVNVPVGVAAPAVTVIVEVPVVGLGAKEAVAAAGSPVTLRVTAPVRNALETDVPEEPEAGAQQHRHDIDRKLVDQTSMQMLLGHPDATNHLKCRVPGAEDVCVIGAADASRPAARRPGRVLQPGGW